MNLPGAASSFPSSSDAPRVRGTHPQPQPAGTLVARGHRVLDRVARIDHQVQHGGLELGRVGIRRRQAWLDLDVEIDLLAERAAEQGGALADAFADIDLFDQQRLPAREGEQAGGELGAALGRGLDAGEIALRPLVGPEPAAEQREVADDDGEQVVEIMRDAAGELPDGFEPLRVGEPAFDALPLGLVAAAADDADDPVGRRVEHRDEDGLDEDGFAADIDGALHGQGAGVGERAHQRRGGGAGSVRRQHLLGRASGEFRLVEAEELFGGGIDRLVDEPRAGLDPHDDQRVRAELEIGAEALLALGQLLGARHHFGLEPRLALAQQALGFQPLGRVDGGADQADRPAVLELAPRGRVQPAEAAIGPQHPEHLVVAHRLGTGAGLGRREAGAVVGMQQRQAVQTVGRPERGIAAVEVEQMLRPGALAGDEVDLPGADLADLLGEQQPSFAGLGPAEGRFLFGGAGAQAGRGVAQGLPGGGGLGESAPGVGQRRLSAGERPGLEIQRVERPNDVAADHPGERQGRQQHRRAAGAQFDHRADQRAVDHPGRHAHADGPARTRGADEADEDLLFVSIAGRAEAHVAAAIELGGFPQQRGAGAGRLVAGIPDDATFRVGDHHEPLARQRLQRRLRQDRPCRQLDGDVVANDAVTGERHVDGHLRLMRSQADRHAGDDGLTGLEQALHGFSVGLVAEALALGPQRVGLDLATAVDDVERGIQVGTLEGAGRRLLETSQVGRIADRHLRQNDPDGFGAAQLCIDGRGNPRRGRQRILLDQPGADPVGTHQQQRRECQHWQSRDEHQQDQP